LAISASLRRLLSIRELQEEQSEAALASVVHEIAQLRAAQSHAGVRATQARRLLEASVRCDVPSDRWTGLQEEHIAIKLATQLADHVAATEREAETLRTHYLEARMERRQVQTVAQNAEKAVATDAEHKEQRDLDEWHRAHHFS
jgi:flagellar biosynthesis chaperone FliJ